MKMNRNVVQITGTALVTSTLFILYLALSGPDGLTLALATSEKISWKDAQGLKKEYMDFRAMRVQYMNSQNIPVYDTLEGFVIQADHLREILDTNRSEKGNPDEVIFYFGQKGKFSEPGDGIFTPKSPNMHIIALGMKGKELLIDDKTGGNSPSIYDKAEPCPPNCPK